ncbi:MAG: hypothetical protein LBC07_01435 [Elusimicrobiota bacterium]|jgi:superoxide reductase|nr:hypothetical protein [Elusimicrobiota bacterium]
MKKHFICKVCGYVALDGKTDKCPVCGKSGVFEEKEDVFKEGGEVLSEAEKKHVPKLSVKKDCQLIDGSVAVRAVIGDIVHPMQAEHLILEVTFYLDNQYLSITKLSAQSLPAAVALVAGGKGAKAQVIAYCNLHGRWFNEIELN